MSRKLTPEQRELLDQCRAAIAGFNRQHAEAVTAVVEFARQRTGVDIGPKPPKAEKFAPWADWTPHRLLRFITTLQRAADGMDLERFADRDDGFTIRDLHDLTHEIDLQAGMNGLYIFGEAEKIAEGPES